jgi:hypothetical protein
MLTLKENPSLPLIKGLTSSQSGSKAKTFLESKALFSVLSNSVKDLIWDKPLPLLNDHGARFPLGVIITATKHKSSRVMTLLEYFKIV